MTGWGVPKAILTAWLIALSVLVVPAGSRAAGGVAMSEGQTVYLPVYSYVFYGDRGRKFDLTATISIRNTDPHFPVTLTSAKYYDSQGKLVKDYVTKPVTVTPLASTHLLVNESDLSGGLGASFIMQWQSSQKVNPPVFEAIMIGTASNQGISFVCRGQVIGSGPE